MGQRRIQCESLTQIVLEEELAIAIRNDKFCLLTSFQTQVLVTIWYSTLVSWLINRGDRFSMWLDIHKRIGG